MSSDLSNVIVGHGQIWPLLIQIMRILHSQTQTFYQIRSILFRNWVQAQAQAVLLKATYRHQSDYKTFLGDPLTVSMEGTIPAANTY